MGRFLNPDNSAFQTALNSEIYVDKTGLIDYTNRVINTKQAFICNSRPRRFGKSITADMLAAYYSKGCDAEDMFAGLKIGSRNFCLLPRIEFELQSKELLDATLDMEPKRKYCPGADQGQAISGVSGTVHGKYIAGGHQL